MNGLVQSPVSQPGYKALLSQLVALNTVSPMPATRMAAVGKWLAQFGLRMVHPGLFGRGQPESRIWIYAHVDTKPPGDLGCWHSDPFQLSDQGGRWFGLGVSDAKFQVLNVLIVPPARECFVLIDTTEECGGGIAGGFLAAHDVDTLVIVDGFSGRQKVYQGTMGQMDGVLEVNTGELPHHPARRESRMLRQLNALFEEVQRQGFLFNLTGMTAPVTERSLTLEQVTLRFDIRFAAPQAETVRSFLKAMRARVRQEIAPIGGRRQSPESAMSDPVLAPFSCNLGPMSRMPRRVLVVPGAEADNNNHQPNEFISPCQVQAHQRSLAETLKALHEST